MASAKRKGRTVIDPDAIYRCGMEAERQGLDPGIVGRAERLAPRPFLIVVERILEQALRERESGVSVSVGTSGKKRDIEIRIRGRFDASILRRVQATLKRLRRAK